MDDLKFGKRNRRGDWAPFEPAVTAPLFVRLPRPLALLKWLPHYLFPATLSSSCRPGPGGPGP